MKRRKMTEGKFLLFVVAALVLFTTACTPKTPTSEAGIPNPASVLCEENGGTLDLRSNAAGNVQGICVFSDGSECDEWAYFREECKPGDSLNTNLVSTETEAVTATEITNETTRVPAEGWLIYANQELGYSFEYPSNCQIIINDDPLKGLTVIGPSPENDNWPQFGISHPNDRKEYLPPEGTDLAQWLIDNNLVEGDYQEEVLIAGFPTIHVRHDRSPQSYAFDRYFFAKSGQLYMIVIGHVGDKEDWEIYDHFLQSFQFTK
jgi:putative hemolysin